MFNYYTPCYIQVQTSLENIHWGYMWYAGVSRYIGEYLKNTEDINSIFTFLMNLHKLVWRSQNSFIQRWYYNLYTHMTWVGIWKYTFTQTRIINEILTVCKCNITQPIWIDGCINQVYESEPTKIVRKECQAPENV